MRNAATSLVLCLATTAVFGACGDRSGAALDSESKQAAASGAATSQVPQASEPMSARGNAWSADQQSGLAEGDGIGQGSPGTFGRGLGGGGKGESAPGIGNGASPKRMKTPTMAQATGHAEAPPAPPPRPESNVQPSRPAEAPKARAVPPPPEDAPIDPNGRFATTYRPGGGHLAAFESAVSAGQIPSSETELVSDIGSRYLPEIAAPTKGALAFQADFERKELAPTGGPVHLRFSIRSTAKAAEDRPPLSVVVVLDVSGSMHGELIKSARQAAGELVGKLHDGDEFGLVTFSTDANTLIPMAKLTSDRKSILEKINGIVEGGGTNISGGLTAGYTELDKSKNTDAVRVAMLLSDGRANNGIISRAQLSQLALNAFEKGIQTSAFGLGTDYDGPLMSQLAGDGAGGYYFLKSGSQFSDALQTELGKRLEPVATALEIRVRLKPDVELLKVYGSRRLSAEESARVRSVEVATDVQTEKRDKIKANRQEDQEGGMRFFIPAFARDDAHSMLLKLKLPEGVKQRDIAQIEVKYKDRLTKKNILEELPLKLAYADSDVASAKTADQAVLRTVQGFLAGETLMKASRLIAENKKQDAVDLLGEREGLLQHAAVVLGEPLFVQDSRRLSRLREHASAKGSMSDPLVLAMMMETAGSVHLH